MADILISHVSEDQDRVIKLVEFLRTQDWELWWNQDVAPGDAIDIVTETQLELAKVVITIWSEHSVQSRLVRNTAFEAVESQRWLPIRIDQVKMPLRYRDYQCIDMAAWLTQQDNEAEHLLVASCESLLSAGSNDSKSHLNELSHSTIAEQSKKPLTNGILRTRTEKANRKRDYATIQLGEWTIEEGQNRVLREGLVKRITPRSMQVLMFLIENGKKPSSIERILGHVWRDRVVVESVVHRCISELRLALEDEFKNPHYIETIAKRGYRIVASISFADAE